MASLSPMKPCNSGSEVSPGRGIFSPRPKSASSAFIPYSPHSPDKSSCISEDLGDLYGDLEGDIFSRADPTVKARASHLSSLFYNSSLHNFNFQ